MFGEIISSINWERIVVAAIRHFEKLGKCGSTWFQMVPSSLQKKSPKCSAEPDTCSEQNILAPFLWCCHTWHKSLRQTLLIRTDLLLLGDFFFFKILCRAFCCLHSDSKVSKLSSENFLIRIIFICICGIFISIFKMVRPWLEPDFRSCHNCQFGFVHWYQVSSYEKTVARD